MTSPTSTSGGAPRIPSWKRLGLKLKSAQSSPDPDLQVPFAEKPIVIEVSNKKRHREPEHELAIKKPKNLNSFPISEPLRPITIDPNTPKSSRKKSVTFTPETKAKDGDSIKQLYLTWVADQKAQDDFFNTPSTQVFQTPPPPKVEEEFDTTLPESERRIQRAKKPKAVKPSKSNGDDAKDSKSKKSVKKSKITKPISSSRPFLAYLRQYHESRATWKFNKNHQNHLLKHAFEIDVVPSDHAHLLYEYVRGLQGGVRTRLRDAAISIKVEDQEETMSDNKRQRDYDTAMNEYVATMTAAGASSSLGYEEGVLMNLSDAAMKGRMAKRMRAEKILAELGSSSSDETTSTRNPTETESVATDGEKRLRLNDGTPLKLGRKRKQRTLTDANDSSDSSESSSDSEDSSSSEDESDVPGTADDSTSSSSSSSSESDTENGESLSDDDGDDDDDDSTSSSSSSEDSDGVA